METTFPHIPTSSNDVQTGMKKSANIFVLKVLKFNQEYPIAEDWSDFFSDFLKLLFRSYLISPDTTNVMEKN